MFCCNPTDDTSIDNCDNESDNTKSIQVNTYPFEEKDFEVMKTLSQQLKKENKKLLEKNRNNEMKLKLAEIEIEFLQTKNEKESETMNEKLEAALRLVKSLQEKNVGTENETHKAKQFIEREFVDIYDFLLS